MAKIYFQPGILVIINEGRENSPKVTFRFASEELPLNVVRENSLLLEGLAKLRNFMLLGKCFSSSESGPWGFLTQGHWQVQEVDQREKTGILGSRLPAFSS